MNAPDDLSRLTPPLEGRVAAEEWKARVDLAAAYRLVAQFRWDDLVFTHITAKIPGTEHFLIDPYGLMFDEITASSLIKIDINGNVLQETPFPINPAGFVIHSAVHSARHDAQCVMHTHTLNGVAVSAQNKGVLPISQFAIFVLGSLAYHDYEGVALRDDEKPRLVADLGDKTFLMLRNHGLLTVGPTVAAAFQAMYAFEATCAVQIRAQAGAARWRHGDLIEIDADVLRTATEQARMATLGTKGPGELIWPGLLRLRLDRIDPGYRRTDTEAASIPAAKRPMPARKQSATPRYRRAGRGSTASSFLQGGGAAGRLSGRRVRGARGDEPHPRLGRRHLDRRDQRRADRRHPARAPDRAAA